MKKLWAFIVALFVFMLVGLSLRAISPFLAGVIIVLFDIAPASPNDVKTWESVGNIFNLVFSGYLGYKTYKSMAKTKE